MSDNDSQPVVIVEKSGPTVAAFLWGAVLGAATALLMAPKSGRETQEELREGARRLTREAGERFSELRDNVGDGYERARGEVSGQIDTARESLTHRKQRAEEALRVGKDAAKQAREDLERRVTESKAAYRATVETESENGDESDA